MVEQRNVERGVPHYNWGVGVVQQVIQVVTGFTQSFFRLLALRGIVHHAYGPDDFATSVPDMLTFFINVPYFSSGFPYDPVLDFVTILSLFDRAGIGGIYCCPIIGVDSFEKGLIGSSEFLGFKTEKPVYLIRPE